MPQKDYFWVDAAFFNLLLQSKKNAATAATTAAASASSTPNSTEFNVSTYIISLRAQSFTSLKADLHQDINGGLAFSRCLNGIFP